MLLKKKTVDDECRLLNNKCIQPCIFGRDAENNITKHFNNNEVYKWESNVYTTFLEKHIFPVVTPSDDQLTYITKGMVSLRTYFKNSKVNMYYTLHELFSYIKTFSRLKFIHGNLHIDSVFLNPQTFDTKAHFFVIDYANSYLLKRKTDPNYKRTSFIGEFENETKEHSLVYWDFFTIYISLKLFFKKDYSHLATLENVISMYINQSTLQELLNSFFDLSKRTTNNVVLPSHLKLK